MSYKALPQTSGIRDQSMVDDTIEYTARNSDQTMRQSYNDNETIIDHIEPTPDTNLEMA